MTPVSTVCYIQLLTSFKTKLNPLCFQDDSTSQRKFRTTCLVITRIARACARARACVCVCVCVFVRVRVCVCVVVGGGGGMNAGSVNNLPFIARVIKKTCRLKCLAGTRLRSLNETIWKLGQVKGDK